MDLSSMLNGGAPVRTKSPAIKSDYIPIKRENDANASKEKTPLYQLNAAIQIAIAKDNLPQRNSLPVNSLLSSPFRPSTNGNDTSYGHHTSSKTNGLTTTLTTNSAPVFGPHLVSAPNTWKPKLSLNLVLKDEPSGPRPPKRTRYEDEQTPQNDMEVQLKTHEVFYRPDEPKVLLEQVYEIQGAYPRGFFVMMAKRNIQHSFVFTYPDNYWFEDLYGLRKSAYVIMRTAEGEHYELHLKPSRDKQWLFGYLIKESDMIRIVRDSMNEIIYNRKLPLVLDLDDTLVRLVGEGNDRFVPEKDLHLCQDRVAELADKRRVVLTERVHEFLEWAQNLFDISVCSLGDQNYVENVVNVLDPQRTCIRGILYSARSEHDYIKKSPDAGRPPKDLLALYSFCALKDRSFGSSFSLPLILDDETRMWPIEQHDNIIEVKGQLNSPVWSVSLFPVVQDVLSHVHTEFFKQFDYWAVKSQQGIFTKLPPSAVGVYKTHLRHMLRDLIAKAATSPKPAPPS